MRRFLLWLFYLISAAASLVLVWGLFNGMPKYLHANLRTYFVFIGICILLAAYALSILGYKGASSALANTTGSMGDELKEKNDKPKPKPQPGVVTQSSVLKNRESAKDDSDMLFGVAWLLFVIYVVGLTWFWKGPILHYLYVSFSAIFVVLTVTYLYVYLGKYHSVKKLTDLKLSRYSWFFMLISAGFCCFVIWRKLPFLGTCPYILLYIMCFFAYCKIDKTHSDNGSWSKPHDELGLDDDSAFIDIINKQMNKKNK